MYKNKRLLAINFLIIVQILFGINFTASKIIVNNLDPFLWSQIRFFISFLIMLLITLLLKRKHPVLNRGFIVPTIIFGVLAFTLGQSFFLLGMTMTSSINASVISVTIPILTLAIVLINRKEVFSFWKLAGLLLALLGVLSLRGIQSFSINSQTAYGDFVIFLCCLSFAIFISYGKSYMQSYDNFWITTWLFGVAALTMFIFTYNKWGNFQVPTNNPQLTASMVFVVLGATIMTYFLNNWSLQHVDSGSVAQFIYLQPVVAGILAWFILKEEIAVKTVVSMLLIVIGQIIATGSWASGLKGEKRNSDR